MDLTNILLVPGKPGLYKLINRGTKSSIVESLLDNKRMPIFDVNRISSLKEIAIYTDDKEVELPEVFRMIFKKEEGKNCIAHTSPSAELRVYFTEILPNFDQGRVYDSNIKKVLQWYNMLNDLGLIDLEDTEEANETAENKDSEKEGGAKKAIAKKGSAKEASVKKTAAKPAAKATAKPTAKKATAKTGSAKKTSAK